jgi:biopolymer transport protein TolR
MATEPEKLSAAQRSKIRRLAAPQELAPDEEGGELNIVPFLDIIMNVLMFVLATVAVTFTATIDSEPPAPSGGSSARASAQETLGLTVIVVPDGYSLKARGGNVAPGCNDTGPGLAVPLKGKNPDGTPLYDNQRLNECARKLKALSTAFAAERQVTVSANPNIPYQSIIGAIDALRAGPPTEKSPEGEPLFPEIVFGLAR